MTKVYLHKYALSSGKIDEIEGKLDEGYFKPNKEYGFSIGFSPDDYSLTKEDAIKAVNQKIDKKIKSLEKQIQKLKALNFEK